MRPWALLLAVLLAPTAASAGRVVVPLGPGFTWDAGPGRHHASLAEASALELSQSREDSRRATRASHELRRVTQRAETHRGEYRRRDRDPAIELWELRLQRDLDAADRRLDLDAAELALTPARLSALQLSHDVLRARQRIELKREGARAERRASRMGRRSVVPRY